MILELAGRRYPVCSLVCPPYGDDDYSTDDERRLGGRGLFTSDYLIPAENGVVFSVENQFSDDWWWLHIYSPVCGVSNEFPNEGPMWLPTTLMLDTEARVLRPWTVDGGPWDWERATQEWIAEAIDRWSRWPVVGVGDGPRARIADARELT